jgi:hypothetical protein
MKFSDWKLLNEALSGKFLDEEGKRIRDIINNVYKKVYAMPNFGTFSRPGEPLQYTNLFSDEEANSIGFNYTGKGELYSVDLWKPEENAPFVTYYVRSGSSEEIAKRIPEIVSQKNAKDLKKSSASPKVLQEAETPDLEPSKPKPETPVDPPVKKGEISDDYDFGDPDTIFQDLKTYVDMIIDGTQPSLLITGSPGVGKTYTVLKQLSDAGLKKQEDFIHVKGRSTAAGMFITLYENNGKIIVFDDCDSVFGNGDAVNILKGALDSYGEREISWLVGKPLKTAEGENVPKSFVFTGKVIFISNLPQKKIDDAIKSRSFVVEVALTPEDMLKKMRKELPNVHPEVPLPLKEDAMDFIESVSSKAENLELNMRTLVKAIKILKAVSNLKVAERLVLQQCSYK